MIESHCDYNEQRVMADYNSDMSNDSIFMDIDLEQLDTRKEIHNQLNVDLDFDTQDREERENIHNQVNVNIDFDPTERDVQTETTTSISDEDSDSETEEQVEVGDSLDDLYANEYLRDCLSMIDNEPPPQFDWTSDEIVKVKPAFNPKRPLGSQCKPMVIQPTNTPSTSAASVDVSPKPVDYFLLYYTEEFLQQVSSLLANQPNAFHGHSFFLFSILRISTDKWLKMYVVLVL